MHEEHIKGASVEPPSGRDSFDPANPHPHPHFVGDPLGLVWIRFMAWWTFRFAAIQAYGISALLWTWSPAGREGGALLRVQYARGVVVGIILVQLALFVAFADVLRILSVLGFFT